MNRYRSTDQDIHTRIYRFVIACFTRVIKNIPKRVEHQTIIYQISSSLTSVGANDSEADATGSTKDFVAKYFIVKKELRETIYWLSVIRDLQLADETTVKDSLVEADELLRIVSSILNKCRYKKPGAVVRVYSDIY